MQKWRLVVLKKHISDLCGMWIINSNASIVLCTANVTLQSRSEGVGVAGSFGTSIVAAGISLAFGATFDENCHLCSRLDLLVHSVFSANSGFLYQPTYASSLISCGGGRSPTMSTISCSLIAACLLFDSITVSVGFKWVSIIPIRFEIRNI